MSHMMLRAKLLVLFRQCSERQGQRDQNGHVLVNKHQRGSRRKRAEKAVEELHE